MVTVALAVVVRTRKPLSTQSTKYVRSLKASYVPVTPEYTKIVMLTPLGCIIKVDAFCIIRGNM